MALRIPGDALCVDIFWRALAWDFYAWHALAWRFLSCYDKAWEEQVEIYDIIENKRDIFIEIY